MKDIFYALRPKQWTKNIFLFLPLVFGQKLFSYPENWEVLLGFFLFSMMASGVYLLNDLIDFDRDKLHRVKRLRPLASGKLAQRHAWILAAGLCFLASVLSFRLSYPLGWVILSYFIFNLIY